VALAGCATREPPTLYEAGSFADLPGWSEADLAASLHAFLAGCRQPGVHGKLRRTCTEASAQTQGARRFFELAFTPWRLRNPDGTDEGLVTGYYEPVLDGSRVRTSRFSLPVFGVPAELAAAGARRGEPYLSRAEIERRGSSLEAPVIAWVEDAVELFFLHIQGSGQLRLPGGERLRLGFAAHNGHAYRSLGRFLVDSGELSLEQASMQGIKAWASANPARLQAALDQNPRYIFFRELPAAAGPVGALGVPLAADYSIAVDPRHVPLGAPVFLSTTYPLSSQPLQRLVLAQDTGAAIIGAVRADLFWGTGDEAGTHAGRMRQRGAMWLLWPRGESPSAR
jgi:membrane-bound lytic murein transglycosylase A